MNTSRHTRSLLSIITIAFGIFAAGAALHAKEEVGEVKAEAYAVLFYADWCGSCKAMDPKLKEARASLVDEPILFVTFDMTNEETKKQSAMLASAIDLEEHFGKNDGKTGFLLVIDPEGNEVVETITKEDSAEAIRSKLTQATKS